MRLPVEERRKIMEAQAEAFTERFIYVEQPDGCFDIVPRHQEQSSLTETSEPVVSKLKITLDIQEQ